MTILSIVGIDHLAITVRDVDKTCAFYDRLFGSRVVAEHVADGRILARQIALGRAMLSVHQLGNSVELVARQPTPGSADVCLRWAGTPDEALALLGNNGVDVVEGPVPRTAADGASGQSVYFRDLDGNLIELLSAATG